MKEHFLWKGELIVQTTKQYRFSYFVGQNVADVPQEAGLSFKIIFECGWLMFDCIWRIRQEQVIVFLHLINIVAVFG